MADFDRWPTDLLAEFVADLELGRTPALPVGVETAAREELAHRSLDGG
ncbi:MULTISPECIES: hypothetical protein [Rhodococcus]|jgi:hypothetical protein|uniref:Uncharacterized protein n=1 Tax=Rhodococcus aetherivorans TaxID=191292 RepID=N1M964_9NOCA|nr:MULTISPECIES: hypothetical protein [Rhodococcus]ETT25084.1 hypothetical protein RR21198_4136 [Rhodococcus rhodochrous ATCC 21198]NCL76868.1 hypothetical protein [Rhodococcus sp. YH1]MBC2587488.1 hypothetical protein [Rhodococcus aetherivorans]MDV6291957.1 hypothetical protein [Rhodococcus aetherivorans]NGP04120.1 hypothetical protein [Rhodococcus sp. 14C212]